MSPENGSFSESGAHNVIFFFPVDDLHGWPCPSCCRASSSSRGCMCIRDNCSGGTGRLKKGLWILLVLLFLHRAQDQTLTLPRLLVTARAMRHCRSLSCWHPFLVPFAPALKLFHEESVADKAMCSCVCDALGVIRGFSCAGWTLWWATRCHSAWWKPPWFMCLRRGVTEGRWCRARLRGEALIVFRCSQIRFFEIKMKCLVVLTIPKIIWTSCFNHF